MGLLNRYFRAGGRSKSWSRPLFKGLDFTRSCLSLGMDGLKVSGQDCNNTIITENNPVALPLSIKDSKSY